MSDVPVTLSEERLDFDSGCRVMVRAASFAVAAHRAGGVTVTSAVPDGFFMPIEGGGASATAVIGPAEARALAALLVDAAQRAETVGPPLYGD
jgi:hypothetical protein